MQVSVRLFERPLVKPRAEGLRLIFGLAPLDWSFLAFFTPCCALIKCTSFSCQLGAEPFQIVRVLSVCEMVFAFFDFFQFSLIHP